MAVVSGMNHYDVEHVGEKSNIANLCTFELDPR